MLRRCFSFNIISKSFTLLFNDVGIKGKHLSQNCFIHGNRLLLPTSNCIDIISLTQVRKKQTKAPFKKSPPKDDYDSDSDDEEFLQQEKDKIKGLKVSELKVDNLRVDSIIKKSLDISRNRSEVLFYEGRIRVNGRNIKKKSHEVAQGDEVDVIKEIHPENPSCLNIGRIEILKLKPTGDCIIITIRKQKKMMIMNYDEEPWVESSAESSNNTEISQ